MFISDEAKGNALIGEAAMNLIFNREEVTVSSLLSKLKAMAEIEIDEAKLMLMHEVCRWLRGFLSLGSLAPERAGWLDSALMGDAAGVIRFESLRAVED